MSSLFYQNSLKSNTAKKDSAIGASEATALNSIQKEQRKKELEKQESSVGKFIEKEDTAESSKKNGFWSSVLDGVQTALDVVGLVPGLGELADGANAVIYTARGDYLNATLSLTACIPFAGWAATGGKFVNKAVGVINKADDIYDTAKTVGKFIAGKVDDIFDTANKAKKYIAGKADDIADIVQDAEKISKGGSNTAYRYVSEGELNAIKKTGTIPNTDRAGNLKDVFVSPGKYDAAVDAEEALQIGKQNPFGATESPTHRIEFNTSGIKFRYGGNVEGGTGIEMITEQSIPVDLSKIFRLR